MSTVLTREEKPHSSPHPQLLEPHQGRRIALIRPLQTGVEAEFQEPLGIEYLAGYLRTRGIDVAVFDRRLFARHKSGGAFWHELSTWLAQPETMHDHTAHDIQTYVGLSIMTAEDVSDALKMIQRIRAFEPRTRFIAGGLFVTTAYEFARAQFPHDVDLIRGEGELPLLELVRSGSLSGLDKDRVAFALAPDGWGDAWRPDLGAYLRAGCSINVRSSRGCSGSCAFCATPRLPGGFRAWKARDLVQVVDEITHLTKQAGDLGTAPIFNFVDDDFGPLARVEEFNMLLRQRGLRIAYSLQLRGLSLRRESNLYNRVKRLAEGGLTRLFVGLESCNAHTLQAWNKPFPPEEMLRVLKTFRSAGVETHIGYIMWHSASTLDGIRDEARILRQCRLFSVKSSLSRMVMFPGSLLYEQEHLANAEGDLPDRYRGTYWQRLSPECEHAFGEYSSYIRPVYEAWLVGATAAPRIAAQAFLSGDRTPLDELNARLEELDNISFSALVGGTRAEDVPPYAQKIGSEIDEICSTDT